MEYTTVSGARARIHPLVTREVVVEAVERQMSSLDDPGFCLHCGEEAMGCEPDARHIVCESCEHPAVFGAEECLLMMTEA